MYIKRTLVFSALLCFIFISGCEEPSNEDLVNNIEQVNKTIEKELVQLTKELKRAKGNGKDQIRESIKDLKKKSNDLQRLKKSIEKMSSNEMNKGKKKFESIKGDLQKKLETIQKQKSR